MRVIAGDFGGKNTPAVVKPKAIVFSGCLFSRKLRCRDIVSIEVVDDSNKANIAGAVGGGLAGLLLAGPIGMLAGSILGGRGKEHVLLIQDRQGRRLLGVVNHNEFEILLPIMTGITRPAASPAPSTPVAAASAPHPTSAVPVAELVGPVRSVPHRPLQAPQTKSGIKVLGMLGLGALLLFGGCCVFSMVASLFSPESNRSASRPPATNQDAAPSPSPANLPPASSTQDAPRLQGESAKDAAPSPPPPKNAAPTKHAPKPKFEQIGYHRNDARRWFTYYVENVDEDDVREFCNQEKQKQQQAKERLLWIDFFNDRQHTPDVTLTGELPESCLPYQVATYRYNPFNGHEELNWLEVAASKPAATASAEHKSRGQVRPLRTWTDASGKFSVKASFAGSAMGKVKLRKEDGSVIEVDLDKLSAEDQKYIQSLR